MIYVEQYRLVIGLFAASSFIKRKCTHVTSSGRFVVVIASFLSVLMISLLVLTVAGDIETNPGPGRCSVKECGNATLLHRLPLDGNR